MVPPYDDKALLPAPLPFGFEAQRVIRCVLGDATENNGRTYLVRQQESPASTALDSALQLPDQPRPTGHLVCPANFVPPVYLIEVNDRGIAYQARVPSNGCYGARAEVTDAINSMSWRTTATFKVTRS